MAKFPNLDGIALEWDQSPDVRGHIRCKGCLFSPALRQASAECTVACGERNFAVLAPISKRLRLSDGSVGQVRVPDVMKQSLSLFSPQYVWLLF